MNDAAHLRGEIRMVDQSPVPRRAGRTLLATLAALIAAAVAGCTATGGTDSGGPGTPNQAAAGPAATACGGADDAPRTIPASAFLEMPENMRRDRQKADGSAALPDLCTGSCQPATARSRAPP
jgi:hypothetical protein